jgi:hypothetical protein
VLLLLAPLAPLALMSLALMSLALMSLALMMAAKSSPLLNRYLKVLIF